MEKKSTFEVLRASAQHQSAVIPQAPAKVRYDLQVEGRPCQGDERRRVLCLEAGIRGLRVPPAGPDRLLRMAPFREVPAYDGHAFLPKNKCHHCNSRSWCRFRALLCSFYRLTVVTQSVSKRRLLIELSFCLCLNHNAEIEIPLSWAL